MPWPPRQPPRDEVAPESLSAFDTVIERARRMLPDPERDAGYYGRLMLTPDLGNQLSQVGRTVRAIGDNGNSFSHAQREFVDQILSADFGTNIVQGIHLNDAISTGVRIEAIEAIRKGHEEDLTDDEKQLADFIRRVVGGLVDKESWEAMETKLGERGVVEYAIFILFLQLTIRLMQAVGCESISDEDLDTMIAEFKAGNREADAFRKRIG